MKNENIICSLNENESTEDIYTPAQKDNGEAEEKAPIRGVSYEDVHTPIQKDNGEAEEKAPVRGVMYEKDKQHKLSRRVLVKANKEPRELLNFGLGLRSHIQEIKDTAQGEKSKDWYGIQVAVRKINGSIELYDATVEAHKVKAVDWLKHSTRSLATMPMDKPEKEEYRRKVQRCIESPNVETERMYQRAGWRQLPNEILAYVDASGVIGCDSLKAWCKDTTQKLQVATEFLGKKELFQKALEQKRICFDHRASLILFLFTHASMISTLFEVAGHPIKFLVGILGPTNSRKTSIAIAICKAYWEMGTKSDAEFTTATKAGIEKEISRLKDGVAIIDDLKPGITKTQQNNLNEKFDQLIRAYGDRVSKKRMLDFSGNPDDKYFPVGGGCVVTMEQFTGVMSSLSRIFVTEISKDDVDNNTLSYYQEKSWIMGTHLYDFLDWTSCNSNRVLCEIGSRFDYFRKQKKWYFERYAEMYATFMIVAFLLTQYAIDREFFDEIEAKYFLEEVESIVVKELDEMEQRLRQYDKGLVVLEAIGDALETGKLQPLEDTPNNCKLKKACYINEHFIFLQLRLLHNIVYDYVHENHMNVHFQSKEEILQLLLQRKVIESRDYGGITENVHKLPQPKGNTKRYLHILRDRLREELKDIL